VNFLDLLFLIGEEMIREIFINNQINLQNFII